QEELDVRRVDRGRVERAHALVRFAPEVASACHEGIERPRAEDIVELAEVDDPLVTTRADARAATGRTEDAVRQRPSIPTARSSATGSANEHEPKLRNRSRCVDA